MCNLTKAISPYSYIILEISEFCNKLLTILKKIAILFLGNDAVPGGAANKGSRIIGKAANFMKECKVKLSSIADVKEFTSLANSRTFELDLVSGKYTVDAKSIMGIFSLDLTKTLTLVLHGNDEECKDFLDDAEKFITDVQN